MVLSRSQMIDALVGRIESTLAKLVKEPLAEVSTETSAPDEEKRDLVYRGLARLPTERLEQLLDEVMEADSQQPAVPTKLRPSVRFFGLPPSTLISKWVIADAAETFIHDTLVVTSCPGLKDTIYQMGARPGVYIPVVAPAHTDADLNLWQEALPKALVPIFLAKVGYERFSLGSNYPSLLSVSIPITRALSPIDLDYCHDLKINVLRFIPGQGVLIDLSFLWQRACQNIGAYPYTIRLPSAGAHGTCPGDPVMVSLFARHLSCHLENNKE